MGEGERSKKPAVEDPGRRIERGTATGDPRLPASDARDTSGGKRDATGASERPTIPRTATLDDPLTTSLLAEVARRSRTIEVEPEQIAEAVDLEPSPPGAPGAASRGGPSNPGSRP
jgi:hypothetical protein